MPWEDIGSLDTGSVPGDVDWIHWCQRFAVSYIKLVCGEPPPGCDLDLTDCDHELGSYPTIGVWYDGPDEPSDYISRCDSALWTFDHAIAWNDLKEHLEAALGVGDDGDWSEEGDGEETDGEDGVERDGASAEVDPHAMPVVPGSEDPRDEWIPLVHEGQRVGCERCWAPAAAGAWEAVRNTSIEKYLVDESHFIVSIRACPVCAQRYVQVTTEMIDWQDGDDPIHRIILPIDDAERERLEADTPVSTEVLESIGPERQALNYDWPAGGEEVTYWGRGIRVQMHD